MFVVLFYLTCVKFLTDVLNYPQKDKPESQPPNAIVAESSVPASASIPENCVPASDSVAENSVPVSATSLENSVPASCTVAERSEPTNSKVAESSMNESRKRNHSEDFTKADDNFFYINMYRFL
jgi:hypothetical protein